MITNLKKFLNEEQDPAAIEKIADKLNGIIMNGESIEYIAVQKKPAVNLSPDCVALTNKRIIFCRPKNLGFSMDFQDYVWKDVIDCKMKESLFGAEFTVNTLKGDNSLDYLPKAQARRLYALAQEQEEIQREVRRQLDLEEKRAGSGSIQVNTPQIEQPSAKPAPISVAPTVDDVTEALTKLKSLWDNQLISRDEYESKKADILSRI